MTNLERALVRIFGVEGGYVNDPHDPGGETNWGISKAAHPTLDIRNLTKEAAAKIYQKNYWTAIRGDELPFGLAVELFDGAVNSGPDDAIRWMQKAAGVASDGVFGPITLGALLAADPSALIARYNGWRLKHLKDLSIWRTYSRGWANRLANNLIAVEDMP